MSSATPIRPVWKANVAVIAFLILVTLSYYYWQYRQAAQAFSSHVRDHVEMVAGAIRMNADRALLSREIIEEILTTFLGNSARFVDYLESVEPFSNDELTAFSREVGLTGIRIDRPTGVAEGPPGWSPGDLDGCSDSRLHHLTAHHLYVLGIPRSGGTGCIQVALEDKRISELEDRIGLDALVESISNLIGIEYIHFEPGNPDRSTEKETSNGAVDITFEGTADARVARARLPLGRNTLVVGVSAGTFSLRVRRLRQEFFTFTAVIVALGTFFSWLLNRTQRAHIREAQEFEQRLAREKEDAALGRASAAITHEIRNPLNAISMGLQRLHIEAAELTPQHRNLLESLGQAVRRTDTIVAELKRYARPLDPRRTPVDVNRLLRQILTLYREACTKSGISVSRRTDEAGTIEADPDLLAEVFENLVKNAIEAQPEGGDLDIAAWRSEEGLIVRMENGGFNLKPDEAETLLAPYFTTKARGSGLGLSIAARIVHAHRGRIQVTVPQSGRLRVEVFLPATGGTPEETAPVWKTKPKGV